MLNQISTYIKNGQIQNPKIVRAAFDSLEDGQYLIKIEVFKKRSLPQNAYYWSVVVPMVKEGLVVMGFNEVKNNDDAHIVMKHLFLKKVIKSQISDEEIIVETSTTDLKTEDFNRYLENIWQWAIQYLNIQVPRPNEQLTII